MTNKLCAVLRICLLVLVGLSLSGCDQMREKLSNLISPKTQQQILQSIHQNIANEKFKEALVEIESVGKIDPNLEGQFAVAAAKSSFQTGENDKGYLYLIKALKTNAIEIQEAMVEPLFEPVRTEMRFVSILTQTSGSHSQPQSVNNEVNAGGGVSIKMNSSGGTEVKAGNVSVKLP